MFSVTYGPISHKFVATRAISEPIKPELGTIELRIAPRPFQPQSQIH